MKIHKIFENQMQNKLKVNYLRVEKRLEEQTGRKRGRWPQRGGGVKEKASVSRVTFLF